MIIDLEQLKKARTAVGITWTTLTPDNAVAKDLGWLSDILLQVIDDIELYGHSTFVRNPEDRIIKKGGRDEMG